MPSIFSFAGTIGLSSAGWEQGMKAAAKVTDAFVDSAINAIDTSVRVAAGFEKTRNTLEVFTGSARRANAELAEISNLARNTQGLSLINAEQGTTRLRALGFAAKTARDLVAGIAKAKVLSGGDEQAVNRVIMNLEQLRAGSPQIKKDIQQMILALPSLSKTINETFGSLDKFQTALKKNPEAALEKFAEAAKKTEVGNAGLSDAFLKLQDEVLRTQRTFGEPIVEPLTIAFKDLTSLLENNQDVFSRWGQYVGDTIRGVDFAAKQLKKEFSGGGDVGGGQKSFFDNLLEGVGAGMNVYAFYGELERLKSEKEKAQKAVSDFMQNRNPLDIAGNVADYALQKAGGKTQSEIDADNKAAYAKLREDKERARQADLASVKRYADTETSLLRNHYDELQSILDVNIRYTYQQEAAYIQNSAQIKQDFYRDERARIKNYYNQIISLSGEGSDEALKAQADKQKELSNLNSREVSEAYKAQRQILELEKRIQDERRQSAVEFKNLQIREIQLSADEQTRIYERAFRFQTEGSEENYQKLIDTAFNAFAEIRNFTYQSYVEQLKDQSLTAEKRVNLEKQMTLDLLKLDTDYNNRVLELDDQRFDKQLQNIENYSRRAQAIFEAQGNLYSNIGGFFKPENFSGNSAKAFSDAFLGRNLEAQVAELKKLQTKALQNVIDFDKLNPTSESTGLQLIYNDIQKKVLDAEDSLKSFNTTSRKTFEEIEQIGKSLLTTGAALDAFDKIAEKALKVRQDNDRDALTSQLKTAEEKLKVISDRTLAELTRNAAQADLSLKNFQATDTGGTLSEGFLKLYQKDLADAQAALENFKKGSLKTTEILGAENAVNALGIALKNLGVQQAVEQTNQYRNSLDGLRQTIANLQAGAGELNAMKYLAETSVLNEQISAYQEIENLKARIANYSNFQALEIEKAQLNEILQLRTLETQKIIESNRTLQDRLRIMQLELPSSTTLMQNSFTDALTGISAAFADSVTAWDKKSGSFFQNVASNFTQMSQQIINELIRIAVMKAILNLIGAISGGGSGASGVQGATQGASGGWNLAGIAGSALGHARGGLIGGVGTGTSDSNLSWLSKGEFVNQASAVKYYGAELFSALNNKQIPKEFFTAREYAQGGLVGSPVSTSAMTNSNNTNTGNKYEFHYHESGNGGRSQQSFQSANQQFNEFIKRAHHQQWRNK